MVCPTSRTVHYVWAKGSCVRCVVNRTSSIPLRALWSTSVKVSVYCVCHCEVVARVVLCVKVVARVVLCVKVVARVVLCVKVMATVRWWPG